MLAEIAVANAAFSVIKEAIGNGKDLYDVSSAVSDFFGTKSTLQRQAHKKGYKSDLQAFMELEKLTEMENHLREHMIWAGRPNLWTDWLQFQQQAKEQRLQEERKALARKKQIRDILLYSCYFTAIALLIVPTVFLIVSVLI